MLVSWDWLSQYVKLDMTPDQLAERLMMAGLNHEATEPHGRDFAINLEVTSNRPDCLGHIGIARETAVLFDRPLTLPAAAPRGGEPRTRLRSGTHRQPGALPPLHGTRDSRRAGQIESRLAGRPVGHDRHSGDQQRGRHYQLRANGVRAAAARLRPRAARRPPDHRSRSRVPANR